MSNEDESVIRLHPSSEIVVRMIMICLSGMAAIVIIAVLMFYSHHEAKLISRIDAMEKQIELVRQTQRDAKFMARDSKGRLWKAIRQMKMSSGRDG